MQIKQFHRTREAAPIIYKTEPHYTTATGVVMPKETTKELKRLLQLFNSFVGIEKIPFYRVDAYFNENTLWVLEINASFVDGWGTALNLSRVSGIPIDPEKFKVFPDQFTSLNPAYLPELDLFTKELGILGINAQIDMDNGRDPIFVYGRVGSKNHIRPYDGIRLDNKLNLALASQVWQGDAVKIPRHYLAEINPWENIPANAVLKFVDKGSPECQRAGFSIRFDKPSGKAPFLSRCYREGKLLAQDFILPARWEEKNSQLVILVIGDEPVAGYTQFAYGRLINDSSIHGPLAIER